MVRRISITVALWSCLVLTCMAQPAATPDDPLRAGLVARLGSLASALDGELGYCIVDPASGQRIEHKGDALFPTASTIKIAILYELFAQADEKRLRLDEVRPLSGATRVGGSGILHLLETPALSLRDYATLMIVLSDNSATNMVIDVVGMDAVNRRMRALGFERIRLQRRMIDLEAAKAGRENLASPCDLARLLAVVHEGRGLSASSRDALLETLRKPKATAFTRAVPSDVAIASKPGGLDGVAVDAALVSLPDCPFIVVGMTTWLERDADGEAALEALMRATYSYFSRLARAGTRGRMLR